MGTKAKKSWFRIFTGIILTICTVFLAIQSAWQAGGVSFSGSPRVVRIVFVLLFLIATAVTAAVIYFIARRMAGEQWGSKISMIAELLYWLAAAGIFVILTLIGPLAGSGDDTLIRSAFIQSGAPAEIAGPMIAGADIIYVNTLSFLFSFLGNRVEMVIYLQLFLQVLTVLTVHFFVRIWCGRIAAYAAGLLIISSTAWRTAAMAFGPETVYMFYWSIILFLFAVYYDYNAAGRQLPVGIQRLMALVVGGACGILVYYDLLGLLLLPLGIYLLWRVDQKLLSGFFWLKTCIFSVSVCGGVFAMFFHEAIARSNTVGENIAYWCGRLTMKIVPAIMLPAEGMSMLLILAVLACFLAAAFWLGSEQDIVIWLIEMLLLCVAAPMSGIALINQGMWITLVWGVLAGLGLQELLRSGVRAGLVERNRLDAGSESVERSRRPDVSRGAAAKSRIGAAVARVPLALAETAEPRYDTSGGTKYIENPLPLPPKPVHRGMDYPQIIPPEKMHYDLEVAEDDDYDIK